MVAGDCGGTNALEQRSLGGVFVHREGLLDGPVQQRPGAIQHHVAEVGILQECPHYLIFFITNP